MENKKVTAPSLIDMKARGEKISMITAYGYPWAKLADQAGVDVLLIGDSLGMVVLGYENTLQVTMEDMVRHSAAVSRGASRALVVADMPFLSFQVSEEDTIRNAGRLILEGGAQAVKVEGCGHILGYIRRMVEIGIPVMGHVGLTPQSVHQFGGFKMQGKDEENAERIRLEALALQDAGVFAIVLEAIPAALAKDITSSLAIPTIGIGAGPDCDGHVLVSHDMLGLYDKHVPSFVKQYADLWNVTLEAFKAYNLDVKESRYPERK